MRSQRGAAAEAAAGTTKVAAVPLVAAVEVWGQTGCTEDVEELVNRSIELLKSGLEPLG